jgi:hypothetical protein
VHFLAPASWRVFAVHWFWPESPITLALTIAGLAFLAFAYRRPGRGAGLELTARRCSIALFLLLLYFALPFFLLDGPSHRDNHFVETLRDKRQRAGKAIELDRVVFEAGRVGTFAFEQIEVPGVDLPGRARIALRGRVTDPNTIEVESWHRHWPFFRDAASYLGLALIALWWPLLSRPSPSSPVAPRGESPRDTGASATS